MIEWLREIMDYPFELDRKDSSISPKTDACSIGKEGKGISESNVCVCLSSFPPFSRFMLFGCKKVFKSVFLIF